MSPKIRTADDILSIIQPDYNNRYDIKSELGHGGMGTIEAVEDTHLKRVLAMKTLSAKHAKSPSSIESFLKEARFTSQLQHPNIIPVHDVGTTAENKSPFYTMKLIEGESLLEVIQKLKDQDPVYEKKYTLYNRLNIFRKVCDAVAYAHSRGVIHRDIKPANIMLGPFGEVLLVDWGLAKFSGDSDEKFSSSSQPVEDSFLTHDGIIKGSLAYLSPEQALGEIKEIDRLTDIFLLGATLYHLLTLEAPYNYNDIAKLLNHAENAKFLHPLEVNGCHTLPLQITDIISKSMSKNKEDRYQSVDTLSASIDDYLNGKHASGFKTFKRGEVIIKENTKGNEAYIIVSGKIEIYTETENKRTVLDLVERGSMVGELALITGNKRSANAVAAEDTQVLVINRQMVLDELRKMPPWLEKAFASLANRLVNLNDEIHPYVSSSCALAVVTQIYYIFMEFRYTAEQQDSPGLSREGLAKKVAENIGLPVSRTEGAINVLIQRQVLEVNSLSIITPIDFDEVRSLMKFIEMENSKLKDTSTIGLDIPVAKIRKFTEIYQTLNSI